MHQYWCWWCWWLLLGKKAVWRHQGHDPGHWLHYHGAAIVHKEFSHRCSRWPSSHQTPNAGLFHLSESVQAAKGQRAEPRESGCSRSLLQTLGAQCYRSDLEFHNYTRVKPSHPIQTQPYRLYLDYDFALTRSTLVAMSLRDYLSHASN